MKKKLTVKQAVLDTVIYYYPVVGNYHIAQAAARVGHPLSGLQRFRELNLQRTFSVKTNTYHIYTPLSTLLKIKRKLDGGKK